MVKRLPASSGRSVGFTLIELVITLMIVALLAVVALPFTRDWMDGNRQMQMRSHLMEGVGLARALALRNQNGLPVNADATNPLPVEVVRLSYNTANQTLKLTQKQADGTWSATPDWQSPAVTGNLTLQLAGSTTAFTCVAFDTRGRLLYNTSISNCALPAGAYQVAIGIGNLGAINVDLL
jgi:type IV fimbrial biogenesis protein FimT